MDNLVLRVLSGFLFFVCAVSVGFWLGFKIAGWRYDSQYKAAYNQAILQVHAQDLANQKMAQEYDRKIGVYQAQVAGLNAKTQKEITSVPIYIDCKLPDSGVQLLTTAVDAANSLISTVGVNGSL